MGIGSAAPNEGTAGVNGEGNPERGEVNLQRGGLGASRGSGEDMGEAAQCEMFGIRLLVRFYS